jgi:hypothetical protein
LPKGHATAARLNLEDDMTETAMAAALKRAGVDEKDNQFLTALAKYLNQGGTIERAFALVQGAAKRLPGGGQGDHADEGPNRIAPSRQPHGDEAGQITDAHVGHVPGARPSPDQRSGDGHIAPAQEAKAAVPSAAAPDREQGGQTRHAGKAIIGLPPAREPSAAQRKAAVAARKASAAAVLNLGWLGSAAMPAGPAYREIRVGEVAAFRKRQVREGVNHGRSALVLARLHHELEKVGQADPNAKVFDVLPPETIKRISRETEMEVIGPMAAGWLEGFVKQGELTIAGGSHD